MTVIKEMIIDLKSDAYKPFPTIEKALDFDLETFEDEPSLLAEDDDTELDIEGIVIEHL